MDYAQSLRSTNSMDIVVSKKLTMGVDEVDQGLDTLREEEEEEEEKEEKEEEVDKSKKILPDPAD